MDEFVIDERGNVLRYFDLHSGREAFEPLVYIHGLGSA
jgi:hypothetical protein